MSATKREAGLGQKIEKREKRFLRVDASDHAVLAVGFRRLGIVKVYWVRVIQDDGKAHICRCGLDGYEATRETS